MKVLTKITNYLFNEIKTYNPNIEYDVFEYGFVILLRYLVYILIMLPIVLYFCLTFQVFLFCIPYFLLRSCVGGIHLNNSYLCIISTVFVTLIIPWFASILYIKSIGIILFLYLIFVSSVKIIKVADHPNKMFTNNEKIILSKRAIVLILIELLISILSYIFNYKLLYNEILFANATCMVELYIFYINKKDA